MSGNTYVAKFSTGGADMWSLGLAMGIERVAIDSLGDVVMAGNFTGTVDLGGVVMSSTGGADAHVFKLNGADGTARWGKRFGGTQTDQISGLALDAVDRIYASGTFRGIAQFDGENPISAGTADIFRDQPRTVADFPWRRVGLRNSRIVHATRGGGRSTRRRHGRTEPCA